MTISRSWPPRFPFTLVTAAALTAAGLVLLFVGYVFGILTEFWFLCLVLLLAVLGFAVLVTVRVVEDSSGGTNLCGEFSLPDSAC